MEEMEKYNSQAYYGEQQYPMMDTPASPYYDEHYAAMGVQPIEVMQDALTPEEFKGYLKGQIIKYSMRAGHKKGEPAAKDQAKKERFREWLLQVCAGLKIDPRK